MQTHSHTQLASERIVIAAPMSFAGSAGRIWKLAGISRQPAARISLSTIATLLIVFAWAVVLVWYGVFGLLLVPYRLTRRTQRKHKREALMHREQLDALR